MAQSEINMMLANMTAASAARGNGILSLLMKDALKNPNPMMGPGAKSQIPWTSPTVNKAAKALLEGKKEVHVNNRSQAEDINAKITL